MGPRAKAMVYLSASATTPVVSHDNRVDRQQHGQKYQARGIIAGDLGTTADSVTFAIWPFRLYFGPVAAQYGAGG